MAYIFVVVVGLLGVGIYLTVMFSAIPGAVDERLGTLEKLPENLGRWVEEADTPEAQKAQRAGQIREVRYLHHPKTGLFGREHISKQVRYRDAETRKIVEVEPELRLARKRTKPAQA